MIRTLKIKYQTDEASLSIIKNYMRQYSSLYCIVFNRSVEGYSQKDIKQYVKHMSGLDLLDSWFIQSSIYDVLPLVARHNALVKSRQQRLSDACRKEDTDFSSLPKSKEKKLCKKYRIPRNSSITFGSRKSFREYIRGIISKDELRVRRFVPIYSIGEVSNKSVKANRKFRISGDLSSIVFRPSRDISVPLNFAGLAPNYRKVLRVLYLLQESKSISISYRLDTDYVYVTIEETDIKEFMKDVPKIPNRVFAIDLNPNYIGWSVVDWNGSSEDSYKLIKSGVISFKPLNDFETNCNVSSDNLVKVRLTHKRRHEILEIAKFLVETARHYGCQLFSVEDLSIKPCDRRIGKRFNRLVNNQWNRDMLINSLNRRCDLYSIRLVKVRPEYSSFLGNILYRNLNLPDMILSSIEISRRGFEFYGQYISKERPKEKNILFPERLGFETAVSRSIEELNIADKSLSFMELYKYIKESKVRYRLSLDQFSDLEFSRFSSHANKLVLYFCI